MFADCRESGKPLVEQERLDFPESHSAVIARLLASWNIPLTVYEPLTQISDDYDQVARLPEPIRTKTELLKLAIVIAEMAVGRWNSWDLIEIPPLAIVERLRIRSLPIILSATRSALDEIVSLRQRDKGLIAAPDGPAEPPSTRKLAYWNLSADSFDFVTELVRSMGVRLEPQAIETESTDRLALVNCLGVPDATASAWLATRSLERMTIFGRPNQLRNLPAAARVEIPSSYGAIQAAF